MVSDVLCTKDAMYRSKNISTTTGNADSTEPWLNIRTLQSRKCRPQRDRYYTEDYALQKHKSDQVNYECDPKNYTAIHSDPTVPVLVPSPPSVSFSSSPRSTITAAFNSTRFLRSRISVPLLKIVRNPNITKYSECIGTGVDENQHVTTTDDIEARSQSYQELSSSLSSSLPVQDHESPSRQDPSDQLPSDLYNNAFVDIQLLKDCIHQLQLSESTPTTPKTSETRTTETPICYQMMTNENPFVLEQDRPVLQKQASLPAKNDEIVVDDDNSTVSSISNDSARRYNIEPIQNDASPIFPPLEIRCHHRTYNHNRCINRNETKTNRDIPVSHNWQDSWVANVPPLTSILNSSTRNCVTGRNHCRPPSIQTSPDSRLNLAYRLDAPKNISQPREVPIISLDPDNPNDNTLSPMYNKVIFKPIREIGNEEKDDDSIASPQEQPVVPIVTTASILSGTFKPNQVSRSKTTSAVLNERMNNRNSIFRKRPSQSQPLLSQQHHHHHRTLTSSRNVTTISSRIRLPRRQFRRTSFNSTNNSTVHKPTSIHIPSKSVPTGQHTMNKSLNTHEVHPHDDPLLRNIPKRRVSQSNKSVFSFGSLVGQSTATSSTTMPLWSGAVSISSPADTWKESPNSSQSKRTPVVTTMGSDVTGVTQEEVQNEPIKDTPKIQKKPTPFYNEVDYYWKPTTKQLFATSTTKAKIVEKPNSITSLQRNVSGCLA